MFITEAICICRKQAPVFLYIQRPAREGKQPQRREENSEIG